MSDSDTWDKRFRGTRDPGPASLVLLSNLHLLPDIGLALDLACGTAGNGLLLAERGLDTELWVVSPMALELQQQWARERGLALRACRRDCEACPPQANQYDVISVAHFLHRPLCRYLSAALKPGGLLFYQTFTANKLGPAGPSRPEFLLQPTELPRLFTELQPRYYRDDDRCGDLNVGERDRALFVGQKPG